MTAVSRIAAAAFAAAFCAGPDAAMADEVVAPPCLPRSPSTGWCGDGGPATVARLASPGSIVALPDGGFAFVERLNDVIRRVHPDGTISTLARPIDRRDPASEGFGCALGQLAIRPDGSLLVGSGYCLTVFAVSLDGTVRRFAGRGLVGRSHGLWPHRRRQDGRLARRARLSFPMGVAVRGRNVYIADDGWLRRVDAAGRVHTVKLHRPVARGAVIARPNGHLLLTDRNRIWDADPRTGRVRRIAGRRASEGSGGDGGPATDASLAGVSALLPARRGVLLAEYYGHRIRRIDERGAISTAFATGVPGLRGDGGSATSMWLHGANGLARDTRGRLLVSDASNDRIRRIGRGGRVTTVAGGGRPTGDGWSGPAVWEPCRGGCGDTDYSSSFTAFYLTGRPIRGRAGRPLRIVLYSTRRVGVVVRARGPRSRRWRFEVAPGRTELTLRWGRRGFGRGRYRLEVVGIPKRESGRSDAAWVTVR